MPALQGKCHVRLPLDTDARDRFRSLALVSFYDVFRPGMLGDAIYLAKPATDAGIFIYIDPF